MLYNNQPTTQYVFFSLESNWWDTVSRAGIYLFKVTDRKTRKRCEICAKLIIKTKRRQRCRSDVFIVNLEHISHLFLVFLLMTLNK